MVSASKSRTVSNSFFASIRQLFKLECLLWSECWDTNLDIKSIDYSWWSTHWLELTKSRVAATNVEEALLYLIFNKTLSRKSAVGIDDNDGQGMDNQRKINHLEWDWEQTWVSQPGVWRRWPRGEPASPGQWSPCSLSWGRENTRLRLEKRKKRMVHCMINEISTFNCVRVVSLKNFHANLASNGMSYQRELGGSRN